MKTSLIYPAACLALVFNSARANPIQHDFIAIDEGMGNLLRIDETDPSKDWSVHLGPSPTYHPRDMQLEGGGLLLISHDSGWSEYEVATGKLVKDVSIYHDVSSARRLENGDLLLAGVDFDGVKKNKGDTPLGDPTGRHVLVVEYDPQGREVRRIRYVGDYLRLLRETAAGTFLFSCNTMFREGDQNGNFIRDIAVPGFTHAWKALRLPNGDTLMSAGYGTSLKHGSSFMVEVDAAGRIVRKFGAADQVPAKVHPYFYGLFQLLPNGDVVAANWQGHGPKHGASGIQIVEFDPSGAIVWHWDNRQHIAISSIQAVLVLDGLDPSQRYDERNGVMEPLR